MKIKQITIIAAEAVDSYYISYFLNKLSMQVFMELILPILLFVFAMLVTFFYYKLNELKESNIQLTDRLLKNIENEENWRKIQDTELGNRIVAIEKKLRA